MDEMEIVTRPTQGIGAIPAAITSILAYEVSRVTHWAVRVDVTDTPARSVGLQVPGDARYWVYYEMVKEKVKGETKVWLAKKTLRHVDRIADVIGIPHADNSPLRLAGARNSEPGVKDGFDNRPGKAFEPLHVIFPYTGRFKFESLEAIDEAGRLCV